MILEGLVTTTNQDDSVNLAPMGPTVSATEFDSFLLRPFQTSRTYQNLKKHPQGVLHFSDDVRLLVLGALGVGESEPVMKPARYVQASVLENCCRYHEFEVCRIDDSQERTELECRVLDSVEVRPFSPFNRAKHAVLEATILATRIGLLGRDEIQQQMDWLRPAVIKTGGPDEFQAFDSVVRFMQKNGLQVSATS